MRRKDREITDKSAIESILNGAGVCRIGLADENEPYVVPVCFGYRDDTIYIHSAPAGKKIGMLAKNPRCCIEVDNTDGPVRSDDPCQWEMRYTSVICTGTASILDDYAKKCAAMNCIMRHYGGPEYRLSEKELERVCIVKISLDGMTGKQYGY
ncbi:MAG: pyridoxamine 5'-phosphate oxidase family protein [Methanoregula sp.]|uniref:pyridoxamine 5'-phosphate oxidase family protein n=1 Tax=Methanoregula sp. TaxID=2052170 RepID=UPI003C5DF3FC